MNQTIKLFNLLCIDLWPHTPRENQPHLSSHVLHNIQQQSNHSSLTNLSKHICTIQSADILNQYIDVYDIERLCEILVHTTLLLGTLTTDILSTSKNTSNISIETKNMKSIITAMLTANINYSTLKNDIKRIVRLNNIRPQFDIVLEHTDTVPSIKSCEINAPRIRCTVERSLYSISTLFDGGQCPPVFLITTMIVLSLVDHLLSRQQHKNWRTLATGSPHLNKDLIAFMNNDETCEFTKPSIPTGRKYEEMLRNQLAKLQDSEATVLPSWLNEIVVTVNSKSICYHQYRSILNSILQHVWVDLELNKNIYSNFNNSITTMSTQLGLISNPVRNNRFLTIVRYLIFFGQRVYKTIEAETVCTM